jgi:hypothetical protein
MIVLGMGEELVNDPTINVSYYFQARYRYQLR